MNLDERRLGEIKRYKQFYHQRLNEADSPLSKDLIEAKLEQLTEEETQILKRCKVEI